MKKTTGPILVVDDDEEDFEILKDACEHLGIFNTIKFFREAEKLLAYLESATVQPFIILCDINMPQTNGIELRRIIFDNERLRKKSIPFVFFSTAASKQQVEKAYDLTVQGFFLKGNTIEETSRLLKLIFDYWSEAKHPNSML